MATRHRALGLDRRPREGHQAARANGFNGSGASPRAEATSGWRTCLATRSTELSASTGVLVKLISGSRYGFNGSGAVASGGGHVWVANLGGNSVTELSASTGALAKLISGSSYGFNSPWP